MAVLGLGHGPLRGEMSSPAAYGGRMSDEERRRRLREASYLYSSSREALIEHVFIAEVLQESWFGREQSVEVLRSEVDAGGYDVVSNAGALSAMYSSRPATLAARRHVRRSTCVSPTSRVVASSGSFTANEMITASTCRTCGSAGAQGNPYRSSAASSVEIHPRRRRVPGRGYSAAPRSRPSPRQGFWSSDCFGHPPPVV